MGAVADQILPFRVILAADATFFSVRLDQAYNALFSLKKDWRPVIADLFSVSEYQHIFRNLNITDKTSPSEVVDVIQNMQSALAALPVIDLKLAFLPSRSFSEQLVDWFDQYGPGPGRLNLIFDPTLIGGLSVGYLGRLYDYSLSKHLSYDGLSTIS